MSEAEVAVRPPWTAGQVARQLGIAESTLRAWHRRYGVGPQAARPGGYRRYAERDLARLRHMRELIDAGMLPSDAARAANAFDPAPLGSARQPGDLVPDVLAATERLDTARCVRLLAGAVAEWGVVTAWDGLCRPALAAIDADQDARGRDGELCVDREHLLSWAINAALLRAPEALVVRDRAPVLLSCVDAEQHTLPLEALAAALQEHGVGVRMLGAGVPTASLVRAVSVIAPDVVVLWAHRRETARTDVLRELRRFPVRRVAAGPGWPRRRQAGVTHVNSLADALDTLLPGGTVH